MKILMVCLGNICRSPLAEGILRSKISEKHTVASAGTISFHEGSPPDKRSTKIAKEYGVDISSKSPKEKSNVIPLIRVLEAKPVGIPHWAYEKNLVA